MSRNVDDVSVDPALEDLLHRALGTGRISQERRRGHLAQLGLPMPRPEAGMAAATLNLPIGSSRTITYGMDEREGRTKRQRLELAAVVLVFVAIAGGGVFLFRDPGDKDVRVSATPAATANVATFSSPTTRPAAPDPAPSTSLASPTPTSGTEGCNATPWLSGLRGIGGVTSAEWLEGTGLYLGRFSSPLSEGVNEVLWISDANVPALPDAAQVLLLGTRLGPYALSVPLEQRYHSSTWSLPTAGEGTRYGIRANIVFPSAGCWQIEAEIGAFWLRAIVEVQPNAEWQASDEVWETLKWRPVSEMGINAPPNCLRTGAEQLVDDFGPLVGDAGGQDTPVYLAGLDQTGALHLSATPPDEGGYHAHVLFVTSRDYQGPLLVRAVPDGYSLNYSMSSPDPQPSTALQLSGTGRTSASYGWRHWSVYLRVPGPGCYALQIDGEDFISQIVFEAVQAPPPPPSAEPRGLLYAWSFDEGAGVVAIDQDTGEVVQRLRVVPWGGALLAASPDGTRIAVPASYPENLPIEGKYYLMIVRTSDWSIEQYVYLPSLARELGPGDALAFSPDGRRLLVYQNEIDLTSRFVMPVYWLGTYDLDLGAWLPDIELSGCPAMIQMRVAESGLVNAMCSSSIQEIDPAVGATANDAYYGPSIASFVVRGDTRYTVSTERVVYIQTLGSEEVTATVREGARLAEAGGRVPHMAVGVSADGRYLAIPTATEADVAALHASEIVVVDLLEDRIVTTIQVSSPFIEIAFSTDGSTAFVVCPQTENRPAGMLRVDLTTGQETELGVGNFAAIVAR